MKLSAGAAGWSEAQVLLQTHMVLGRIHFLAATETHGNLLLREQNMEISELRRALNPLLKSSPN